MKLSEFIEVTGVNKKTARWIYSKLRDDTNRELKHRHFTQ